MDHFDIFINKVIHFGEHYAIISLQMEDMSTEHLKDLIQDVIHLVRFGGEGRSRDVKALARRMAQKYRDEMPELAEGLAQLAARNGALRSARRPLPVDADSRMALARVIEPSIARRPVLDEAAQVRIAQLISEHRDPAPLRLAGLSPSKSALLVGPPGVGKTMTAHWIAAQLNTPLVVLDLATAISSFLGKSGQNVRQLFDFCKEFDCVLLLDEVDAIAKRRADETDLGELKRLVNVLLQELDEWPEGSLVLAATNHPDLLDPAIWRRFEVVLELSLPSLSERQLLLAELGFKAGTELQLALAEVTGGLSQAEIVKLVRAGRRTAVIASIPEADGILEACTDAIRRLPQAERHSISERLIAAGISQRRASDLTGTSRNTLRKRTTRTK